jgi:hypothetical protein
VDDGIGRLRVAHEIDQPAHPVEAPGRSGGGLPLEVDVGGEPGERGVEVHQPPDAQLVAPDTVIAASSATSARI